ncbi:MAG: DUF4192 domain-containing protein [Aeromicrobium erythreum]
MTDSPVFTAHDTADLVNALPLAFGFTPRESLCVIGTRGPRHRFGFSARLDLTPDLDALPPRCERLLALLERHGAEGVIVVAVDDDADRAREAALAMLSTLEDAGTVVPVVVAWADDETVWATHDPEGRPHRRSPHHPAVVHGVVHGRDIVGTREDLAARVAPGAGERRAWLDAAMPEVMERLWTWLGPLPEPSRLAAALGRALDLVRRGPDLDDGEVLELAALVQRIEVRDACWEAIDREAAADALALWQRVARTAPVPLTVPPLCLAAISAHQLGDGAQMNVALDAADRVDPTYSLAVLLRELHDAGIGPAEVDDLWRRLGRDRRTA